MIFSKKIKLQITNPCSENWDTMQPIANGKHCLSCAKNVLDFTNMSEKQIIGHLKINKGGLCGRLTNAQLGKTYVIKSEFQLSAQKRFFRYVVSLLLTSKVFINKTNGQTNTITVIQNETLPKVVINDSIVADSNEVVFYDTLKSSIEFIWEENTETIFVDPYLTGNIQVMGYMPMELTKTPYQEFIDFFKPREKLFEGETISEDIAGKSKSPEHPKKKEDSKTPMEAILPNELRIKSEKN